MREEITDFELEDCDEKKRIEKAKMWECEKLSIEEEPGFRVKKKKFEDINSLGIELLRVRVFLR